MENVWGSGEWRRNKVSEHIKQVERLVRPPTNPFSKLISTNLCFSMRDGLLFGSGYRFLPWHAPATMLANLGGQRQQIYADCAAIYENSKLKLENCSCLT